MSLILPIALAVFVATEMLAAGTAPRLTAITQLPTRRCAQAPSMPEGRAGRAVEAQRRALHGAEHSGTLQRVMAVVQLTGPDDRQILCTAVGTVRRDQRLTSICRIAS